MKTITFQVSEKELLAICTYADMCGESVSTLIRKISIQQITLMKITRHVSQAYDYNMLVPEGVSDEEHLIEENYNKIRGILGMEKIKLS